MSDKFVIYGVPYDNFTGQIRLDEFQYKYDFDIKYCYSKIN